jgi:hypothetical protein
MRTALLGISLLSLVAGPLDSQEMGFEFEKVPQKSGFRMEGYWVWGGSMIRVGQTYHLFASRWEKKMDFPREYRFDSEIVRATSASANGPFTFAEVVIGERDSACWDANMAHNPTIHKIGGEYVLFYIGSDFNTYRGNSGQLLRRVGYASSPSIEGPWQRPEEPLIDQESNNPAIWVDDSRILLLFRDARLRVYMAVADRYQGPYRIVNDNVWPDGSLEDFYLFRTHGHYHFICEDNTGSVSGHVRWGVDICSDNGVDGWIKADPVIVYDHDIEFDDGRTLHCVRRERPQGLIEDGEITHLITGVYDGTDSWCQPVRLKKPIIIDVSPNND